MDSNHESSAPEPGTEASNLIRTPLLLTNSFNNPLTVWQLEQAPSLPEYPETILDGHAYRIPINVHEPPDGRSLLRKIQYGNHLVYQGSSMSPFLQEPVYRTQARCTGVKICPYLSSRVKDQPHSKVTDEMWSNMISLREKLEPDHAEKRKREAVRLFYDIKRAFSQKTACHEWSPTCEPKMRYPSQQDIGEVAHPWVECSNATALNQQKHFFRSLAHQKKVDLLHLYELFTHPGSPATEDTCAVIEPVSTRRRDCGFPHHDGPQPLEFKKCGVQFNILIPKNVEECPYYIFTSHGAHTHPPPPPPTSKPNSKRKRQHESPSPSSPNATIQAAQLAQNIEVDPNPGIRSLPGSPQPTRSQSPPRSRRESAQPRQQAPQNAPEQTIQQQQMEMHRLWQQSQQQYYELYSTWQQQQLEMQRMWQRSREHYDQFYSAWRQQLQQAENQLRNNSMSGFVPGLPMLPPPPPPPPSISLFPQPNANEPPRFSPRAPAHFTSSMDDNV